MTTVREVMSTDLVTVEPSTMMIEAVRAMSTAQVGSVLVLEDGALVGIFTERDVLRAFDQMHADPARVSPLSKGMTREASRRVEAPHREGGAVCGRSRG